MQWEQLTSADFHRAVRKTGVCVLAAGVVEKHGDHLPLGTDFLNGHKIACLAAEKEPAVVFPPFYFGQIYEARCFPGTITIKPTLLLELFEGVLDEIGRNGLRKIIFFNAHGGNRFLLPFLTQSRLWQEKPYSLYHYLGQLSDKEKRAWKAIQETAIHEHACECETSISLANHPELVHMDRVPSAGARPLGRMKHVPGSYSGFHWYSNYPDHYAGDARSATRRKGEAFREILVHALARFIADVKADRVLPALQKEFFSRVRAVSRSSSRPARKRGRR